MKYQIIKYTDGNEQFHFKVRYQERSLFGWKVWKYVERPMMDGHFWIPREFSSFDEAQKRVRSMQVRKSIEEEGSLKL